MRNTIRIVTVVGLALLGTVLVQGCASNKARTLAQRTGSTHHAVIRVFPAHENDEEAPGDYAAFMDAVNRTAKKYRFTTSEGPHRQFVTTTAKNVKKRIAYFVEESPIDPEYPIEIMTYCDDGHPFRIKVSLSEGISEHYSERLMDVYGDLVKRLESRFGDVNSSIW